ncbi:hypothetical protein GCM10027172_07560 [Halomonas garicola]
MAFFSSDAFAHVMTDGSGRNYNVTMNDSGAVMKSGDAVIYLGNSCDAFSEKYGRGTWGWANGGVIIQFIDHRVGFPRQESPFNDSRCPI